MSDPFAEKPVPWFKRIIGKDRTSHAPKRAARVVSGLSGLAVYLLPAHHHSVALVVLAGIIMFVPAVVIETWYKRRHRRESEQLFVLPESPPVRASVVDR